MNLVVVDGPSAPQKPPELPGWMSVRDLEPTVSISDQ